MSLEPGPVTLITALVRLRDISYSFLCRSRSDTARESSVVEDKVPFSASLMTYG